MHYWFQDMEDTIRALRPELVERYKKVQFDRYGTREFLDRYFPRKMGWTSVIVADTPAVLRKEFGEGLIEQLKPWG